MSSLLRSFLALGKATLSTVVILILAITAFLVMSFKLGLVTGSFFLLAGAFAVLLFSVWLGAQGHTRVAKLFAAGAALTVATIVIQVKFPGLFHLGQATAGALDRQTEHWAQQLQTPHPEPCAPLFIAQTPPSTMPAPISSPQTESEPEPEFGPEQPVQTPQ